MGKKFNFEEAREKAIKAADQELERGLEEMATEKGTKGSGTFVTSGLEQSVGQAPGQAPIQPVREITAPAIQPLASTKNSQQQGQASVYQEPTQNINIPIPTSQHTRLKIISAQTRQPMKDMVVQAIGLWLDVQEGKREVKSE
jgi:hypothetical protein